MLCDQAYAYGELLESLMNPGERGTVMGTSHREPLMRGSLLHLALAHYYIRIQAQQLGHDPDRWYAPHDAILVGAQAMRDDGAPLQDITIEKCQKALTDYSVHYASEMDDGRRVIAVEQPLRALLRQRDDGRVEAVREDLVLTEHGLTADDPRYRRPDDPVPFRRTVNGRHWFLYTQRVDLITWNPAGYLDKDGQPVWNMVVGDHKTTSHIKRGREGTIDAYSMHGQFWGLRHLAALCWPELFQKGRIRLEVNLIGMPTDKRATSFTRSPPSPAPHRESRHWRNVLDHYLRLEQYIEEAADPNHWRTVWDFPATGHEIGCMGRYGRCDAWELCQKGPKGLAAFEMGRRVPVTRRGPRKPEKASGGVQLSRPDGS